MSDGYYEKGKISIELKEGVSVEEIRSIIEGFGLSVIRADLWGVVVVVPDGQESEFVQIFDKIHKLVDKAYLYLKEGTL